MIRRASRLSGDPDDNLIRLLELRLENIVYRLGFARTITAAREVVRHGHILVNQRRNHFPSFQVSEGDSIQVRISRQAHPLIVKGVQSNHTSSLPSFLEREQNGLCGTCRFSPVRSDLPLEPNERIITQPRKEK